MSFRDELRASPPSGGGENDDVARMLKALNDGSRPGDHAQLADPFDEGTEQRGFTGFIASLLLTLIVLGAGLATVYAAYGESVFTTVATWFAGTEQKPVTAPAPTTPRRGDVPPEGLIARPADSPTQHPVAEPTSTPTSSATPAAAVPTPPTNAAVPPLPVETPKVAPAVPMPTAPASVSQAPKPEDSPVHPVPSESVPSPSAEPAPVANAVKAPAPTTTPSEPAATHPQPAHEPVAHEADAKAAKPATPVTEKPAATPATETKPAVTVGGRFAVQIGTFGVVANAEELKQRVEGHGYPAMVVNWTDKSGKSWRAVRVGPYKTDGEARKIAAELQSNLKLAPQVVGIR